MSRPLIALTVAPQWNRCWRAVLWLAALMVAICTVSNHDRIGRVIADEVSSSASDKRLEEFTQTIWPILEKRCIRCHGPEKQQGGLRIDSRDALLKGGESQVAAVVPSRGDQSEMLRRIAADDPAIVMPPSGDRLTSEQITLVRKWIDQGAHWHPEGDRASSFETDREFTERERNFWAFRPIEVSALPPVWNSAWPTTGIDHFVLSRLEKEILTPSPKADPTTLLRRLRFDLTGRPPTANEMADWMADPSAQAYQSLVDRLLASPEFGERWGRHWLDITYWADTTGVGRRTPLRDAWRYRDYVVDSFNQDRPVSQFIREQIAGDLLPADSPGERQRINSATAYFVLGPWDFSVIDKQQMKMDMIDLQIDLVGRSLLGLSLGCARCHDHKFDPIPTRDYYALAGIFQSTQILQQGGGDWDRHQRFTSAELHAQAKWGDETEAWEGIVADLETRQQQGKAEQAALRKQIEAWKAASAVATSGSVTASAQTTSAGSADLSSSQAISEQISSAEKRIKQLDGEIARNRRVQAHQKMLKPRLQGVYSASDQNKPTDVAINLRGNVRALGAVVPRGVLKILPNSTGMKISDTESGRLQLADWLVHESNPLTPRVYVNRLWHHLFGVGLVSTVDNFGTKGDLPSHPELLDYLASQLIRSNWSTKAVIRELVLSETYQMASYSRPEGLVKDPSNRLLWRMNPRRLEAEAIRDSILFVSGGLDRSMGGSTLPLTVENLFENATPFIEDHSRVPDEIFARRSVYLPVLRGSQLNSLDILSLFDFADPDQVVGARTQTTVPLQTLFLLNSEFMQAEASRLAKSLLAHPSLTSAERIRVLYSRVFNRAPTSAEIEEAWDVLDSWETEFRELKQRNDPPRVEAWSRYIQMLLGSAEFLYRR